MNKCDMCGDIEAPVTVGGTVTIDLCCKCYKEMLKGPPVSNCCGAPADIQGQTTRFYICRRCGKPCEARRKK